MPTKYVEVRGFATYYYYSGATTLPDVTPDLSRGRKIVFVHGAGSNGHTFHHQIDGLAAKHSPVALDLPGHGRSAGVEGLTSVRDYADFVIAFMDSLELKSAVIAGRSMGGAIAMEMAIRYPQRVEALVLIATAAKFNISERISALRAVSQGRAPQAFNTDGYLPKTAQTNFDAIREGWMEQIKTDPRVRYTDAVACTEVDLRDEITKIKKPALVICGADDKITTPADAEFIAKHVSGAHLEMIPDAAHAVTTEKPREVNAAIESFLESAR